MAFARRKAPTGRLVVVVEVVVAGVGMRVRVLRVVAGVGMREHDVVVRWLWWLWWWLWWLWWCVVVVCVVAVRRGLRRPCARRARGALGLRLRLRLRLCRTTVPLRPSLHVRQHKRDALRWLLCRHSRFRRPSDANLPMRIQRVS